MSKRTNKQQFEMDMYTRSKIYGLASMLIHYGTIVAVMYIIYLIFIELSGKETVANIILKFLTSEESGSSGAGWIWIALTFSCFVWASIERWFRKRKTADLHARIHKLEKRIDPNRISSGILSNGDTRPEDKDL